MHRSRALKPILISMVSAAVLLLQSVPSHAFMTFAAAGGAIHFGILKEALSPLGISAQSLAAIRKGCDSQDIPFSKNFTSSPPHHCDDNTISEAHSYWSSRLQQAVEDAANAPNDGKTRDKVLFEFGEAMHTVQDFYSHSNY